MKGRVNHFEIPADNVARAQKFYERTFEWRLQPVPGMDYIMVGAADSSSEGRSTEVGAINGGMGKRAKPLQHPVFTITVPDIDGALRLIERNGGKTVQKKQSIGPMGSTAYFSDSEGNTVGLFQPPPM